MSDGLLQQLKGAGASALADKVGEVDQLEPEEHERRVRAANFGVERHWKKNIRPLINWLVLAVSIILVVSILAVLGSYLWDIRTDTVAKGELLGSVVNMILVSGATLYIEGKFGKKD